MKVIKLVPMVQLILDIDWLTTKEFCNEYGVPLPYFTGDVKTSADKFLQVDAVKHRMFVSYAKTLNKKIDRTMFFGNGKIFLGFDQSGNEKEMLFSFGELEILSNNEGFWILAVKPNSTVKKIERVQDLIGIINHVKMQDF